MENIIEPSDKFDFSQLNLENPVPLQGGNFFTKLNFGDKKLPLYIQLSKCISKHGIIKNTSTKKSHIDLLFNYFETDLLTWFENLEIRCRDLIFEKKDLWFQTELDLDDIEHMFISPAKSYKSGKFITVRAHIPCSKQIKKDFCMIYDENERTLESSYITDKTQFIPLIHIDGIKFSSKSFQLDITLPQIMVLSIQDEIKKGCLIKHQTKEDMVYHLESNQNNEEKSKSPILDNSKALEINEKKESLNTENTENVENVENGENSENGENLSKNDLTDTTNEVTELTEVFEVSEKQIIPEIDSETKKSVEISENKEPLAQNANVENLDNNLQEVDVCINNAEEEIVIKKPNEIYYEIYKAAREKAKHMKKAALEAYLEARNIKTKYMLNDMNNSEDELSNYSEIEE
jgi:hypothetical protein